MMRTRIIRPTLAELWRVLLAPLEAVARDADPPSLARSMAVAGLIGRPALAFGVGIERRGTDFVLITPDDHVSPEGPKDWHDFDVCSRGTARGHVVSGRCGLASGS
jgi:hypothetical protein